MNAEFQLLRTDSRDSYNLKFTSFEISYYIEPGSFTILNSLPKNCNGIYVQVLVEKN